MMKRKIQCISESLSAKRNRTKEKEPKPEEETRSMNESIAMHNECRHTSQKEKKPHCHPAFQQESRKNEKDETSTNSQPVSQRQPSIQHKGGRINKS